MLVAVVVVAVDNDGDEDMTIDFLIGFFLLSVLSWVKVMYVFVTCVIDSFNALSLDDDKMVFFLFHFET